MTNSSDAMKHLAAQLAEKIYSGETREVLRMMQQVGLISKPGRELEKGISAVSEHSNRVGVWKLDTNENGESYFTRDSNKSAEWGLWAQIPKFHHKGRKKRIVFLGESAARGFLYDPSYTPAQVLESILQLQLGEEKIDVIDLARTNANIKHIGRLAKNVLVLEPDALVIFAGNNWGPNAGYSSDSKLCQELAYALREHGVTGFRQFIEDALKDEIIELMDEIAQLYSDIPVYWVVPEFCLGDWKDPDINAPCLNTAENTAWINACNKAKGALESSDVDLALLEAEKMLFLDQGNCSTTHYILAQVYRSQGDIEKERSALENAKDSSLWDMLRQNSPRIMSLSQRVLRDQAVKHDHFLIDLPKVFREYTNNKLPGKQLFLDYCHLSSEGIRLAMSEVAVHVLALISDAKTKFNRKKLFDTSLVPNDSIEAEAYFLAAIHNAHWGQSQELVLYYCQQALKYSNTIADIMRDYIEIQNNQTPIWMQKATESLVTNISPTLQRYFFQMEFKSMDEVLFGAFVESMSKQAPELGMLLNQVRIKYHSVCKKPTNMLAPFYHNTSISNEQTLQNATLRFNDYYEAFDIFSNFKFIGESGRGAKGRITLRLPSKDIIESAELNVHVSVNQVALISIKPDACWKTWEFEIPGELIVNGINKVAITWPLESVRRKDVLKSAANSVAMGKTPELFPVFGHIYSFVIENSKECVDDNLLSILLEQSEIKDDTYEEECI